MIIEAFTVSLQSPQPLHERLEVRTLKREHVSCQAGH